MRSYRMEDGRDRPLALIMYATSTSLDRIWQLLKISFIMVSLKRICLSTEIKELLSRPSVKALSQIIR